MVDNTVMRMGQSCSPHGIGGHAVLKKAFFMIAGLMVAGSAFAEDAGRALAQRSVCLSCHQVDSKRVGPSFRDIAIRYGAVPEAVSYLAGTIREGSRGRWGAIPMPAQRHVNPETATQLAQWIMSMAPASVDGLLEGETGEADTTAVGESEAVRPPVIDNLAPARSGGS
jgi:cytochrome c